MAKITVLAAGLFVLGLTFPILDAGAVGVGEGQRCGGFAGIRCAKGLWCDPDPGMCDTADAQGTCVNPRACAYQFIPACGCDGRTYARACDRQKRGVAKKHDGQCRR